MSEPEVKPWNFEVAIVRDCDGHIVELAKNLGDKIKKIEQELKKIIEETFSSLESEKK